MHKKIIALVVGIGLLLAIAISLLTQQRDAYAWSTNEDRLDQDFWDSDWTPGDNAQIINAVYGDGLGQLDKTRYTKYWTQHICDPNTINVVYINSGTNNVPDTLLGNTIYVLESGPHIKTGTVTMSDDCTAIVGQKTTSYSTGATLQFSGNFATGLYIDDATNIVVGQILFQPPTLGGNTIGTAIHTKNIDSSTIYVGEVRYYYNQGVLIEGGSNIYYNNSANYGNPYGTVVTGVNDIMIGESTGQRFFFIRDNQTGLLIDNSQNVQLYGDTAYNTQAGAHIQNSSGVVFRGRYYTNNIGAGVIIENSTGIIFNKWQSNNPAFSANGGYGLYMKNVSGVTGNGLFAIGNTTFEGYGLYMENVTNLYLSNVVVRENIKNGIHITGSQNISLINTNSTGNSENGIQIVSSTNIAMSGGLMSGNQNHGVFLDQSSSGNIITGITSRENTFAGVYIANGANYNILQSSNIAGNGQNGVFINDVSYNTITGVVVTGTIGSAGITIMGSNANNNLVYNSSLYQNLGPGLVIAQGYANQVTNSVAYENNNFGMVIAADAYNNTISYSTSYNNIGYGGFAIDGSLGTPVNNTLDNIYAYGNDTDGLFLSFVTGVNYINNVYTYNNANNGVYIQDSANISGYNIHAYSNGVDGVNLLSANNNSLSFVQTYANTGNGIVVRGSSDNILQNIKTFANMDRGMTIEAKSPRNTVYNIQSYYNPVGIQITDDQTTQTTISNGLVYNNAIGLGSYNFTTFNNIAVFNNDTGAMLYGPRNILNNLNIFNNNAGIYIYSPIASDNKFNNISVYNNTKGIEIESSGNTYNGLHMFANTTKFIGTSGTDTQLDASSYPWASLFNNNLNDTGAMTCNWAIQATNASGQNVLPYPYCDTRGLVQTRIPSLMVQYTFFPNIYKQQQAVKYSNLLPNVITTASYIPTMFVGDFAYSGYTDFGGNINLTNEGPTFASGGFIYRYDSGSLELEMNTNTGSTQGFVVTGVDDVMWDGVLGSTGSFNNNQYYLYSEYLLPGNGLKVFRVGYDIAGQGLISNYYGQIRGVQASVCGDSVIENTEICDDGNTNNNDGCDATCQVEHWDCAWFSGRVSTGFVPHNVSLSVMTGIYLPPYSFDAIIWGDGSANGNISTGNTHTYMTGSSYTGSIQVTTQFDLMSATNTTCEFPVTVIDPTYCGDGILQTPNGSGFNEQCDLGSGLNGDGINGCSVSCTIEIYGCTQEGSTNYNPQANTDDGSCVAPYCGDGIVLPETTCIDVRTRNLTDAEFNNQDRDIDRRSYTWSYNTMNQTSSILATNMSLGNILTGYQVVTGNNGPSWYISHDLINSQANYVAAHHMYTSTGFDPSRGKILSIEYDMDVKNGNIPGSVIAGGVALHQGTTNVLGAEHTIGGYAGGCTWISSNYTNWATQNCLITGSVLTNSLRTNGTIDPNAMVGDPIYFGFYVVNNSVYDHDMYVDNFEVTVTYCAQEAPAEQCDFGDNDNGDGCSSTCEWETPSCTLSVDSTGGFAPLDTNLSYTMSQYAGLDYINYGDSQTGIDQQHTYISAGNYTPTAYVYNSLNPAYTASCSSESIIVEEQVCGDTIVEGSERCDDGNLIDGDGCSSTCDMENPSCNWFTTTAQTGSAPHNFTISVLPNIYTGGYIFNQIQWMVGVIGSDVGDVFTDNTYTYTGAGSYTARVRVSAPAGPQAQVSNSLNCSRPIEVLSTCGNFVIEGNEQCDDGNTLNGDGCTASCIEELDCSWFSLDYATGTVPHEVTVSFNSGVDVSSYIFDIILRHEVPLDWTGTELGSYIFNGTGRSNVPAQFSTGHIITSPSYTYTIPGQYKVTVPITYADPNYTGYNFCEFVVDIQDSVQDPICGNGIIEQGETCDDGNTSSSDGCSSFCVDELNCDWFIIDDVIGQAPHEVTIHFDSGVDESFYDFSTIIRSSVAPVVATGHIITSPSYTYTIPGQYTIYIPINYATYLPNFNDSLLCEFDIDVTTGPVCGNNIVELGEECDGSNNCRNNCTIQRGSSTPLPEIDECPTGDFSSSYYDRQCGSAPVHSSAPVGKFCIYDDEDYLARGSFDDILGHRGELPIEVMRVSCLHRGRHTKAGLRRYEPNSNIQRDEALKTLVKIIGVEFEDFTIKSEELLYNGVVPFADVSNKNRFSHYASYAFAKGLTEGLYTSDTSKKYLSPTKSMTRYEATKAIVIAYEKIHGAIVTQGASGSKITDIPTTDPNYSYVRKAEVAGLVQGYLQKNGTFLFKGNGSITRAEFAKIVAAAFNEQLIDVDEVVITSSAYNMIIESIQKIKGDKLTFIRNLFEKMKLIDDDLFLKKFKIKKDVFMKVLADKVLLPMVNQ